MAKSGELMFSIKVGIKYTSLEGLSALDERRRLKLPDHTQLHISSSQAMRGAGLVEGCS